MLRCVSSDYIILVRKLWIEYNKAMKKLIFGIFAHPDDEAFGPSATFMKEVDAGAELYLICVTKGEGGMNIDHHADLGYVRMQEWSEACELMGAKGRFCLDFADGSLCSNSYRDLGAKIEGVIKQVCEEQADLVEISLVTFDDNGLTGHLDHVAVSLVTTAVFHRLRKLPPANARIKELAYFCLSEDQMPMPNLEYFSFWPAGRPAVFIDRRVDVRDYLPRKYAVMKCHQTQRTDAEQSFAYGNNDFHAIDNFHVLAS